MTQVGTDPVRCKTNRFRCDHDGKISVNFGNKGYRLSRTERDRIGSLWQSPGWEYDTDEPQQIWG